jgi:sugar phosphate isomerase/epimerase
MRLGISSFTYSWAVAAPDNPLTLDGLLDKATAHGVRLLQIGDNLPLHARPDAEIDAFVRRAGELGVMLELGTRGIGLEHLRTYIELAKRIGSRILRVVIDTASHEPSIDETISALRHIMPTFEAAGVYLAIENHDRIPVGGLAAIITGVGSPHARICMDCGNSLGTLEGPAEVLEALGPYAVNVHIKDFDVFRRESNMGFHIEGRACGGGKVDIPRFLARAADFRPAHGFDYNVILELWTPKQPTLSESIALEAKWAAESVQYLRGLIAD